jgi:hypothetical protein
LHSELPCCPSNNGLVESSPPAIEETIVTCRGVESRQGIVVAF